MDRFRLVALAAVALIALPALAACGDDDDDDNGGGAPTELQLGPEDRGSTVSLAVPGTLVITLPSNPSTGFSWSVVEPGPEFLELEGEPVYTPDEAATAVVGSGGTQAFTFTATGPGTSTVNLQYNRTLTPPAPPADTFTLAVETR